MKLVLKLSLTIVAILIVGLVTVAAYPPVHFRGYGLSDWFQWIVTIGEHPGTRFAPGFSEAQFAQIKIGMTKREVRTIAGKPLYWETWASGRSDGIGENWSYSESVTNIPDFHLRDVRFNSQGRVVEVWKAFLAEGEDSF